MLPALRDQFPALDRQVNGHPLAYLDNAATTQKPEVVLRALRDAYVHRCANVHRGVHALSVAATEAYEAARDRCQRFIGAAAREEIIFTKGTTEAINLAAHGIGATRLGPGDRVVVSEMEHHANLVPWQLICAARGAELVMWPFEDDGRLPIEALAARLDERVKVVAVTHVSNTLGTVNDIAAIARVVHDAGALLVVDGAQAVAHRPVDVTALDCDVYAFSAHKVYGPTGVGVLYAKRALLEQWPPYQGGGDMIEEVRFAGSTWAALPHRFEAGTPNVAGVIGMGAALQWLEDVGLARLAVHEAELLRYAEARLDALDDVRILGRAPGKAPVVSFLIGDIHPHDVGTVLDMHGVAVRSGHHCTQPIMQHYNIAATVRVSFAAYTLRREIDQLLDGLEQVRETFR